MRAVSTSRTSPTRITSGSWRKIDFSPVANVRPAWSAIWIWLTRGKMYSTGSSIVMTLMSRRLISDNVAYNVVVLPLPVGPPTITMPNGALTMREYKAADSSGIPNSPSLNKPGNCGGSWRRSSPR